MDPREVVAAAACFKFKKHSDNILRWMVWFLGCPACGQELDSMILMDASQFGMVLRF